MAYTSKDIIEESYLDVIEGLLRVIREQEEKIKDLEYKNTKLRNKK